MPRATKKLTEEQIQELFEAMLDGCFGDGQNEDIIMDGFQGINEMDDEEQIEAYNSWVAGVEDELVDDDSPEPEN